MLHCAVQQLEALSLGLSCALCIDAVRRTPHADTIACYHLTYCVLLLARVFPNRRRVTKQVWLFVGVLLILGSGNRWIIPLAASLVFTALVIIIPGVYEYLLNDKQRSALNKLLPRGKKAHGSGSWEHLDTSKDDTFPVKDVSSKDAGLPVHRRH